MKNLQTSIIITIFAICRHKQWKLLLLLLLLLLMLMLQILLHFYVESCCMVWCRVVELCGIATLTFVRSCHLTCRCQHHVCWMRRRSALIGCPPRRRCTCQHTHTHTHTHVRMSWENSIFFKRGCRHACRRGLVCVMLLCMSLWARWIWSN